MLCYFKQRHAKGPDVGGDGVGLTCDALRRHVIGSAYEGIGVVFGSVFAAYAEVAEADLAGAGEEDVGGFDIWLVLISRSFGGLWVREAHLCE